MLQLEYQINWEKLLVKIKIKRQTKLFDLNAKNVIFKD